MSWAIREHTDQDVDAAGAVLADPNADPNALESALSIINNWRSSHNFPLNTFQVTLRNKARQFYSASLIAQRLKRLRAIRHKLQKHTDKPIPLSKMQDIGGCRAVLKTVAQVKKVQKAYLESDLRHQLILPIHDYIERPKYSGYRGIHMVYTYNSDKKQTYNGLKIEVQLRTQLQHAWATAVEIVGFFRKELLKSSEGDPVWKHFFKLMANEIVLRERSSPIPGIPAPRNRDDLREQLRRCTAKLDAMTYLHAFGQGIQDVQEVDTEGAHFFLLELDVQNRRLKVTGYQLRAKARASIDYAQVERTLLGPGEHDAVLVSVESVADLKRAYTNYYLDMRMFIETVEQALGNGPK